MIAIFPFTLSCCSSRGLLLSATFGLRCGQKQHIWHIQQLVTMLFFLFSIPSCSDDKDRDDDSLFPNVEVAENIHKIRKWRQTIVPSEDETSKDDEDEVEFHEEVAGGGGADFSLPRATE